MNELEYPAFPCLILSSENIDTELAGLSPLYSHSHADGHVHNHRISSISDRPTF